MAKTKQTARKGSGPAWAAQQKIIQRKRQEEAEEKKKQQEQYEAGCEKIKRDHEDRARKGNQTVTFTTKAREVARLCVPKSAREATFQQVKEQRARREIAEILRTADERATLFVKRLTDIVKEEEASLRSRSPASLAQFAQINPDNVLNVPADIPHPSRLSLRRWDLPQEERKGVDEKELYVQSLARQCEGKKGYFEDGFFGVHRQFVADLRAAATRAADGLAALLRGMPPAATPPSGPQSPVVYLDDPNELGQHDVVPHPGEYGYD
jgi:hypothetical protein